MTQETQIVQVKLPNGAVVGVEVAQTAEEDRRIALEAFSFDGVNHAIEGMVDTLWDTLRKVAPQKATVEFGFEIGVQNGQLTGIFIKGSGKANLKVTLEWSGAHSPKTADDLRSVLPQSTPTGTN